MPDTMGYRPRRLGHANLWVSDIERSIRFYESVLGIELVRRERPLLMGFHSNGNSHHDVGMIEISRGKDRYGRDGMVQIPKTRGTAVGLNHLGWEMTSQRELVEAYKRTRPLFDVDLWTVDHIVAHSVYVPDPDGNMHEFYADALDDWRTVFNLDDRGRGDRGLGSARRRAVRRPPLSRRSSGPRRLPTRRCTRSGSPAPRSEPVTSTAWSVSSSKLPA